MQGKKATPELLNKLFEATKRQVKYYAGTGLDDTTGRTPRLLCSDGFHVSVQVGDGNYCEPRNSEGPHTKAELGFPTEPMPSLYGYCEDLSCPTDTVYGYVPLEAICDVLNDHGGLIGYASYEIQDAEPLNG